MVGLFHHPRQHFPQPRSRSRVTIVSPRPKITVCLGVIINARLLPDCTGVCHRWSSRTSMTPTSDDTALFVAIHHLRPPHGLVPTDRIVDDRGIRFQWTRGVVDITMLEEGDCSLGVELSALTTKSELQSILRQRHGTQAAAWKWKASMTNQARDHDTACQLQTGFENSGSSAWKGPTVNWQGSACATCIALNLIQRQLNVNNRGLSTPAQC